ncbi:MAG: hypothetical protein WC867_05820 [Candidatus Pacearchaeota archaeon]|jgi:hypothetical protein
MKIGVFSDRRQDSIFNPNFEDNPDEAVLYDLELPAQIKRGLEIISDYMPSGIGKFPYANQTSQGHHGDYGLVFRIGETSSIGLIPDDSCANFTYKNLVARISYGMEKTPDVIQDKPVILNDPTKISRLHLNVYGARNFLSTEIEEQAIESFNYTTEVIHFSLRWVNGKFDNSWNEPKQWLKEKDSRYLNKPQFNPMRTTYFETKTSSNHLNGNFYHDLSGYIPNNIKEQINSGKTILSMNEVLDKIGPRKPNLLPPNIPFEDFIKEFPAGSSIDDIKKSLGYNLEKKESFPNIGYSKLCTFLYNYGIINNDSIINKYDSFRIPEMTMDEGVDYIFQRVLPAVKMFISV